MAYFTKYQADFTNVLNETYQILFDFLADVPYASITPVTIVSDGLVLRCTAGDENRLYPILGTECLIKIMVDESEVITIADLIATHDLDIRITVNRIEQSTGAIAIVFQGYVVVEDNNQPLQDRPYILSIRALDGLGLLKGLDLVDTNNLKFVGNYSIIQWVAQIIYKTGQTLPIRVYFNFLNNAFTGFARSWEVTYLNSVTFSEGDAFNINSTDPTVDVNALTADDCYTALEKIIRCFRCRMFMENGCWHIVNLWEHMNPDGYTYDEYLMGDPVSGIIPVTRNATGSNLTYNTTIGKDEIIFPVDIDQNLYLRLAVKWVKLTYKYDQSQNKVCNQNYTEGDPDPTNNGTITDPSNPLLTVNYLAYLLYCWTHVNYSYTSAIGDPSINQTPPTKLAYIRSVLDQLGYEQLRYVVIQTTNVSSVPTAIISSGFLVDIGDKISFSVDFQLRNSYSVGSPQVIIPVRIVLFGDDGVKYFLIATPNDLPVLNYWSTSAVNNGIQFLMPASADWAAWNTISFTIENTLLDGITKIPSGTMVVYLFDYAKDSSTNQETHFKNLALNINVYLNGSYTQVAGDYNYSASDENIKQTLAEDVQISDSPKRYFKGALIQSTGDLMTPSWARRGHPNELNIDGNPFRFTGAMERIMWNLLGRMVYKIEGNFKGLVYVDNADFTVNNPAGFLNKYFFIDSDFPTKAFILTSYENDIGAGKGRRVYVEVLKDANDNGWNPPNNYKFAYIFQ